VERAIGVAHRPESKLTGHYFRAVLAEQFDAYVWFEETRCDLAPSRQTGGRPSLRRRGSA
jgi:erythromycin esterase-like protein